MEALHVQPDFNDLSDDDEDDDENGDTALPASLKKLMGLNKTRNKTKDLPGTGNVPKGAGTYPYDVDKKVSAKVLDEINKSCTVLGSDEKSAIM